MHPPRAARSTTDRGAPTSTAVRYRRSPTDEGLQFPGCQPVRIPRHLIDDYDGRLEYWEARTETAWIVAEPGGIHESMSRRLPELARLIASVRGAPIRAVGSVGLRVIDAAGRPERIMQADETLYLHPRRARMPSGPLVIGRHDDLPDVVLEVDHTHRQVVHPPRGGCRRYSSRRADGCRGARLRRGGGLLAAPGPALTLRDVLRRAYSTVARSGA